MWAFLFPSTLITSTTSTVSVVNVGDGSGVPYARGAGSASRMGPTRQDGKQRGLRYAGAFPVRRSAPVPAMADQRSPTIPQDVARGDPLGHVEPIPRQAGLYGLFGGGFPSSVAASSERGVRMSRSNGAKRVVECDRHAIRADSGL